jgi:hypothetical protein
MDLFSTLFPGRAVIDTLESEPAPGPVDTEEGTGGGSGCVVA